MHFVELDRVSLRYGEDGTLALAETTLAVATGEFVAVVGPSGCGKSSLMKVVTGLAPPSGGRVTVSGRAVAGPLSIVGMAFQNPTLLPWRTALDNVMMPLKIVPPFKQEFSRKRKSEYRDRVEESLKRVGLAGFGDKFPWQLSGGMQQRASLCRALIHDPTLLLLDEPFGALDQFTREELWEIMQALWIEKQPTVLLVTHDLKEACYLATRICVMQARPGRIVDDSEVPFARPRAIETSFAPEFVALTQRLRERIVAARAVQEAAS